MQKCVFEAAEHALRERVQGDVNWQDTGFLVYETACVTDGVPAAECCLAKAGWPSDQPGTGKPIQQVFGEGHGCTLCRDLKRVWHELRSVRYLAVRQEFGLSHRCKGMFVSFDREAGSHGNGVAQVVERASNPLLHLRGSIAGFSRRIERHLHIVPSWCCW